MIEKCENKAFDNDSLLDSFPLHEFYPMINFPNHMDLLEDVCTKRENVIDPSYEEDQVGDRVGEEE